MLEIIYSVLSPLHKMQQQALRSHAAFDTKIVHAVAGGTLWSTRALFNIFILFIGSTEANAAD